MPYPVEGFLEISEDVVQILLMLEVLLSQNSEVEDLFGVASLVSEPGLIFSNYFFGLRFNLLQMIFSMTLFE